MRRAAGLVLAALALGTLTGQDPGPRPKIPRLDMEARLGEERFLIVYGTADTAATRALRERGRLLARRLPGADTSRVRPDHAVSSGDVARHAVVLLGGPRENAWTRRLAERLPVRFTSRGFEWFGRTYDRAGDVLHLVYPNPEDPRRFLILVAGNSAAAMTRRGGWFLLGGDDWRIHRDGRLLRAGRFAQAATQPWSYDPALDIDEEAEREQFERALVVNGPGRLSVRAPADLALASTVLRQGEIVAARTTSQRDRGDGAVQITLYPSLEIKGRFTDDTRNEHVDAQGRAHAAQAAAGRPLDLWSVAAAVLVAAGADPKSTWLEPAAVQVAERVGGERWEVAVSRLRFARLWPSAADAAGRARGWQSPLILVPARAVLVRALCDVAPGGAAARLAGLLAREPGATLDSLCAVMQVDPAALTARYTRLADSLARAGARAERQSAPRRWTPAEGFQRGVCLAHGVNLQKGYLSAAAGREIGRLWDLKTNWISLTPFGYLPAQGEGRIVPSAAGGPHEETDEAIVEAAARARALGLRVWLKPHLWSRGWVGELAFDERGWETFFASYRDFILHYAVLAQREGIDGLVVGHELVTATRGRGARWRQLIADVRRVYTGTLTYGANWGEELEQVDFWDDLDLVGVSFYAPLAPAPTRDTRQLRSGAESALRPLREVAERTGLPVVILEAGFAPHAGAPVRPWTEEPGDPDLETQRACYEALVEALEGESWVAGVFWWKWFTSPDPGGPRDPSFSPRGKPAERVIAGAMRRWESRSVRVAGPAGDVRSRSGGK